jgi:2'-5' RNA ligase
VELQAEHERVARKVGLEPETRKFSPHITLARLRDVKPVAVAEYLGVRGFLPAHAFTASQFAVFSSKESTGGGPYVVEASYPLMEANAGKPVAP